MILSWKCIFLVLCVVFNTIRAQKGCPPSETILPCRCLLRGEEYQIWCSHSDLPRVLEGLRAVGQFVTKPIDELILENNLLPSLPGRSFFPLKVMRLMLRHNGLERVSSDWLVGLETSLMELFIVEPELRTLPDDTLLQLVTLEAVTLQTNLMKRLPLFAGLPKLRYLQLESLSLLEISSRNFKDIPALEKLHISSSPRLTRLEGNLLRDLPSLKLVNISNCGVNWMHPRAITRLPNLKELSLIGNKIVDAGMVGRGSRDLPVLEVMRLDYNYIDKLNEAAFVDLPSLKRLYLSNNRITEIHHGAFHQVPMLKSLDLNKNMLRRVHPESFLQHSGSGLEELWLVENDISHVAELRSLLDALPRLTFLDMSYNNLEAIPFGALRGHATLEHLHLDFNKIHLIDREAFMAMPALRELRLKNNSLSDRLEGPLWNLPALKGLDLSGNFFRRLEPRLIANLPSLRRIDLSANDLTSVNPEAFLNNPALEHVNLSMNSLVTLHPATFRHLLNLYELDVSRNGLLEFVPGLPRGIEYLHMSHNAITNIPLAPSPDLDLPALRMLDLSFNGIQKIPTNSMRSLPQLRRLYLGNNLLQQLDETSLDGLNRLETLDVESNRIYQIHPNTLKEMTELRNVNLRNNRLDFLVPDVFKNCPRLKRLDLSQNQLAEILAGTLDNNKEIQMIDASENALVQLSQTFYGMQNLRYLDLTKNRIKNIDPEILSSFTSLRELKVARNFIQELKQGAFYNLQHLKVLDLDNNELEIVEANAIRSLPVLKSLKLSQNKLRELPNSAFNNLPSLQVAELQENHLQSIGPNAFNNVPHLLMLNLSYNELLDTERAGLRSLRSLEMLDISNNRISKVTSASLQKMEWLVELKMDNNVICGVQGSPFNGMPRLRVLSLRNNKMMSFPEYAVNKLRGNIAVLDIDGNPIACNCNMLWMQAWLQEASTQGPRCVDGSYLREMRLSREECPEEQKNTEVVAPGCEAELLSAPGTFGTSQVFSQWMKLKSNGSKEAIMMANKNKLAPSPEESEYFYDEYIDYPYNETSGDATSALGNDKKTAIFTTKSPHYTSGDTPTIYAAASKNASKPDIPKEVVNSPSTSGFTFFGVPLPSINLNNILGAGNGRMEDGKPPISMAERKTAIVNNPIIRSTGRGYHGAPMQPPSQPEIQTGGFIPVLPGSGGFKPIIPPHLLHPNFTQTKVHNANISRGFTTEVSATKANPFLINKNDRHQLLLTKDDNFDTHKPVPKPVVVTTKSVEALELSSTEIPGKFQVVGQESVKNLNTYTEEIVTTELEAEVEEVTTVRVTNNSIEKRTTTTTTATPELETSASGNLSIIPGSTVVVTTDSVVPVIDSTPAPPVEQSVITSVASNENSTIFPEKFQNKEKLTGDDVAVTATSLSALLVPGGQQPHYRPAGRPSVTKVQSPHVSGSSPLQSSLEMAQISEPLAHNREGKTTRERISGQSNGESVVTPTGNLNNDNWYFANYNKTNIEPYIGRIEAGNSSGKIIVVNLHFLLPLFIVFCKLFV